MQIFQTVIGIYDYFHDLDRMAFLLIPNISNIECIYSYRKWF